MQVIYYAMNIVAAGVGSNTVQVSFNTAASYPDIRIAEYSGISPTKAVDIVAAAQGSGSPSSSGSAITTNANDLLVGAKSCAAHDDRCWPRLYLPGHYESG
jgi:hypothetical protein